MCLPALRLIKNHLPDAGIYLACRQYLSPLYKNIDEITGIIPLPGKRDNISMFKTAHRLRQYRFHRGLLFTNSFHSAFLFRAAGIRNLTGYVKDCRGVLLRQKLRFPDNNKHHIHFYLDLAAYFLEKLSCRVQESFHEGGIPGLDSGLIITGEEKAEVSAALGGLGVDLSAPLLGIAPSTAYGSAKEWPPERFRELILCIRREKSLSGSEILLFGSAGEREKIAGIVRAIADSGVHNLAGRLSLRFAAAAVSLCALFISNDSGLMHIASSLNLPLVALFGPTLPHKTGPRNANARVHYHPPDCAPCLHRVCPLVEDNHTCMKSITVDTVLTSVLALWPGSAPAPAAAPTIKNE